MEFATSTAFANAAQHACSVDFVGPVLLYKIYCIIGGMAVKGKKQGTKTYSASEAREHFAEILDAVEQGEEVVITKHGVAVAQLTGAPKTGKVKIPPPGFLLAEGWRLAIADDFDAIPEGFEEYV
jgi:prevent-host-death family protein